MNPVLESLQNRTRILRILVVDDDEVDRAAIQRYLAKSGLNAEVTEAQSAAVAHEYLTQQEFNCVFLDYYLPDRDGIEVLRQLRMEGFTLPIIVLTGQGDEQVAVELMKAGASDYLSKARLSSEGLARLIRNAMKVYRAEQRTQAAQQQLRQTNALLREQNQELEQQRQQIQRQNLQLLKTNRLKSEFLATVTHEIRTPLNAIMGFSQILRNQTKGRLNDYQLEMVSRIFTNGENLLTLVNDILDMSVIEADRLVLKPCRFDLGELIQVTVAELMPLSHRKNLNLQVSLALEDSEVYNDRFRVKQILVNLLTNAIKFTDVGSIHLSVSSPAPNAVEIVVEDTGIGIVPEQLDYIFQPFSQGDQTVQRRYSGTGLGLAITHSLVSMMEGIITVESQVGQGSKFVVRIPKAIFCSRQ